MAVPLAHPPAVAAVVQWQSRVWTGGGTRGGCAALYELFTFSSSPLRFPGTRSCCSRHRRHRVLSLAVAKGHGALLGLCSQYLLVCGFFPKIICSSSCFQPVSPSSFSGLWVICVSLLFWLTGQVFGDGYNDMGTLGKLIGKRRSRSIGIRNNGPI